MRRYEQSLVDDAALTREEMTDAVAWYVDELQQWRTQTLADLRAELIAFAAESS